MWPITHRTIAANGIGLHIAECGTGPVVILCHGFPESWYSWRHQLQALAGAGYHAIAPDMRGYGQSDRPKAIDQYTVLHLVGDMVGLLDSISVATAPIVGHDWGAVVAWHAALLRPDRFPSIVALSVPFLPRSQVRPTSVMPQDESHVFYQLYFQEPGVAEAALERDANATIRSILWSTSGDAPRRKYRGSGLDHASMVPRDGTFLTQSQNPSALPPWLEPSDIEFYAKEYATTGFAGGLNWYRNIDRNWELLGAFAGAKVTVPALYVFGDRDLVYSFPGIEQLIANLAHFVPRLERTIVLPGCGHWTQQERPEETSSAVVDFLRALNL